MLKKHTTSIRLHPTGALLPARGPNQLFKLITLEDQIAHSLVPENLKQVQSKSGLSLPITLLKKAIKHSNTFLLQIQQMPEKS